MKDKINYLLKNTLLFAISNFATKLITFLLIPLYTYKLSTAEYGTVDLLYTVGTFLYPLITLNIAEAIFRFSMDKDADQNKIVSIGVVCVFLSIILSVATIPVLSFFAEYKDYSWVYFCYLISLSVCQISLTTVKGQEKLRLFAFGNILNTILVSVLSIILILYFELGILGYFLSYIISNLIVSICIFICDRTYDKLKNFNFDKDLFKKMSKYSVVLIPTSFMWWIINSSDRVMITNFISSSANGIYAISYKIPSLLTVLASIFNQAWVFSAVNEKDSKDSEKYTNEIFSKLFNLICIVAVIILAFIKIILKIMVSSEYYVSWKYTPFLIFGFVFMTSATFISTSYNVYKDSKGFLFSGLCGAIVNLLLNFLLIPIMGIYGAALATAISYVVVFIYRLVDTKKYVKIKFCNWHYLLSIVVLVCSCFTLYLPPKIGILFHSFEILIIIIINKNLIKQFLKYFLKFIHRK